MTIKIPWRNMFCKIRHQLLTFQETVGFIRTNTDKIEHDASDARNNDFEVSVTEAVWRFLVFGLVLFQMLT